MCEGWEAGWLQNLCGPVSLEGLMPTTQNVCPDEGQQA